jgi:hypothetical protein
MSKFCLYNTARIESFPHYSSATTLTLVVHTLSLSFEPGSRSGAQADLEVMNVNGPPASVYRVVWTTSIQP